MQELHIKLLEWQQHGQYCNRPLKGLLGMCPVQGHYGGPWCSKVLISSSELLKLFLPPS